ncbi:MAG: hypothetical protein JWM11_6159 [Planctomycetaceae bacterium]|nr:hypothetical protein [Planctomycetaceae bacterium]
MSDHQLPADITNLLSRLRARIQRYVLIEGLTSLLAVMGILFWLSLGLDWSYFWIQRADLPRWVRFLVEISGICLCLSLLLVWVAIRFFRSFRQRALALVLERRFPELNDRLITAIELGEREPTAAPLSQTMLAQTVEEAREASSRLDLSSVFDRRPLLRAGISASCLTISILAFALCFTDVFETWFRRNVLLANEGWRRATAVDVAILAEPDDREVLFQDRTYKHPRGSDLKILATVLSGMQVPTDVQFRYVQSDGTRGRRVMSQLGQNQFKDTLDKVTHSLDFYLMAGDAHREMYHVEVVDPPRIDQLLLQARYPAYTGLNQTDEATGPDGRVPKPVLGTQVSLPVGTDFLLAAVTNKPLVKVRVQTSGYVLEVTRDTTQLTLFQQGGQNRGGSYSIPHTTNWIAEDGRGFSIPFLLGGASQQTVVAENSNVVLPLRLPPSGELQITLTDTDDIRGAESSKLAINSIEDKIPEFDIQLRGIASSITRKAIIPVTGTVKDDYGVMESHFFYKVDSNDSQVRSFPVSPQNKKVFELKQSEKQPWLRFDVLPLELKPGQKLSIAVQAADGDNISGPHLALSENYNFVVVTDEELLSQLYARELNLRQRLEQIITEVQRTQTGLILARQQVKDLLDLRAAPIRPAAANAPSGPPKTPEKDVPPADDAAVSARQGKLDQLDVSTKDSAERALFDVRKNRPETEAIARNLEDIREEMVNNGVDTPLSLQRLDEKLIGPLNAIHKRDFEAVDQRLGLFRLDLQENRSALNRLDECVLLVDQLKRKLETVLNEMRKMETYKELLERLKTIKALQEALKKRTETENKRSIIKKLK